MAAAGASLFEAAKSASERADVFALSRAILDPADYYKHGDCPRYFVRSRGRTIFPAGTPEKTFPKKKSLAGN